jgi:hypothetical protein
MSIMAISGVVVATLEVLQYKQQVGAVIDDTSTVKL